MSEAQVMIGYREEIFGSWQGAKQEKYCGISLLSNAAREKKIEQEPIHTCAEDL